VMLHGITVWGSIGATLASAIFCYCIYGFAHFISVGFKKEESSALKNQKSGFCFCFFALEVQMGCN
jgi:hypothetical protein